MKSLKHQVGMSIIEFTLLATAVMLVMFGVIEVGRYVYSVQVINEMTREAARLGVVCHVSDQNDIPALVIHDNAPVGFTADNITIEYLNQSGNTVTLDASMDEDEYNSLYGTIKFVRASVSGYQYQMIGFMSFLTADGWIQVPLMETTLPVETLGVVRPTTSHPEERHTDC
ncbi:TadE/TadG family type IV pilus assembly protein [Vibrio mangrovi]|uniref:Pilus assembly protein n=1 Tax=Vibrio mangrovi TaxID=474394 RepID=A0A1Y6J0H4_9VIBR|nr:TadE family protein [Vibrio mangrovi]MDW6002350.1 pilus assembly protein [Vibrio mangrovi]SMS02751.1 TadE-like protein [Vibrio mangrovi]